MYTEIEKCRVCGNEDLVPVFSLGDQTLTGVFPLNADSKVPRGPVDLVRCNQGVGEISCGLVQLKQSYDVSQMYGDNYGYRSGLNSSMVDHLHRKVNKILALGILEERDIVIDIGSNDGTTLGFYPEEVYRLVGVDPTGEKFSAFYRPDIQLVPDFFSRDTLFPLLQSQKAKVITSFSMFYDLEAPVDFAKEVASLLHKDGVWILEQSYLPTMLKTNSFDTICHEHLEFYGLKQIAAIGAQAGLKVADVEFNSINGGSFSIVMAHSNSNISTNDKVIQAIFESEKKLNLDTDEPFRGFRDRVHERREQLINLLQSIRNKGDSIYGLGASTKGNVLLQFYNLNAELLDGVAEVNSEKFGKLTPHSNIPILSEEEVLAKNPEYLLVLPWHFKEFFLRSEKFKGRKLIFPLPDVEVIET